MSLGAWRDDAIHRTTSEGSGRHGTGTASEADRRIHTALGPENRDRLIDALAQALRLADGLGALRLRELVEWMADQIGVDPAGFPSLADELSRAGLTIRERDVLPRLIAGRSNKEIGVDLGISEKTAEIHVSNVMRKLEVTNRVEAATRGMVLGLGRSQLLATAGPGPVVGLDAPAA